MPQQPQPRLSFLLDAPAGTPPAKLQVAKLGNDFQDPRYGTFAITADEVERWARNLEKLPGRRALIDRDHSADKAGGDRDTQAAGWITAIRLEDGVPMADVEWTPLGEQAIRDKVYLFFSPTYGPYSDERGETHADTLIGGALTNRPFLNMPVISLASAPSRDAGAWHPGAYMLDAASPSDAAGDPSDSRRQMPTTDLTKLANALGLADDADEPKLLEAITALKAPEGPHTRKLAAALGVEETADEAKLLEAIDNLRAANKPADQKTLEQQAAAAGFVMLTKTQADTLNAAATEVPKLREQLRTFADERRETAWQTAWNSAVDDFRAAPAEEEGFRELYDANPEATLRVLAARPKIMDDGRRSSGKNDDKLPPNGVMPEQWALDQKVQAYILEHPGTDYIRALAAVEGHSFGATA